MKMGVAKKVKQEISKDWIRYDFSNEEQFTGLKPVYCVVGKNKITGESWSSLFVNVVEAEIARKNPAIEILRDTALANTNPSKLKPQPFFLKRKKKRERCVLLSNDFWINVSYSTANMIEQMGKFCLHCGYTKKQIEIYGAPMVASKEDNVSSSNGRNKSGHHDEQGNDNQAGNNSSESLFAIDSLWDKPMTAAVIVQYLELKDIESSQWDNSIHELTERLRIYVGSRFSSALIDECTFWNVAAKITALHSIYSGAGNVKDNCTTLDSKMFQLYQANKSIFFKYLTEFRLWIWHVKRGKNKINQKRIGHIFRPEPQVETKNSRIEEKTIPVQEELRYKEPEKIENAWDMYETAKLIEMCIQIQTKEFFMDEVRQLSKTVTQYAKRNGVSCEGDTSRTVYGIIKRTPLIDYLLSDGSKGREGANQIEKEMVKLYRENPRSFQGIIDEANRRMTMEEPVAAISQKQEKTSEIDAGVEENCLQLLRAKFPKGIRPASSLDCKRFYNFYSEEYGEELSLDSSSFILILKKIGKEKDGRIVAQGGEEQKRLLEKISNEVKDVLLSGISCIYLESLFNRYKEEIESSLQVYKDEELIPILKKTLGADYDIVKRKRHGALICLQFGNPAPNKDIKNCIIRHGTAMTYAEMEKEIWFFPFRKIKQVLSVTPSIIHIDKSTYMAVELFPFNQSDLEKICELIRRSLNESQSGIIKDEDCRSMVEKEMPSLANDLREFTLQAFHNALSFLLWDRFAFSSHVIGKKTQSLDSYRIYLDFCKEREKCTLDDLQELSKEVNTPIYWSIVHRYMFRINEEEFWQKKLLEIDVPRVDSVLEQYCQGEYMSLGAVRSFLHFPPIEVGWTPYLLESYLYSGGSRKFKLLHISFLENDCIGAIVRKESNLYDYKDLLIDVLAHSEAWTDKKSALEFLVAEGYLKRKRYDNLNKIMKQAQLIREKKKS